MLSKNDIETIIRNQIESNEKIGEQSSGSGHLGFVSYTLDEYSTAQKQNQIEIDYYYTLFVETEFTFYPDNPPMSYKRHKTLIVPQNP